MENQIKISIVLVNYNLASFLDEAILSVIQQNYSNTELIIVDGGSTDNSVEIIKKYEKHITWWISEPDDGQYDAVQKGFEQSTGEIMAWLNSDDKYMPGAFTMVSNIFEEFKEVNWLTGIAGEYTPEGTMVRRINLPWSRWSKHRYYMYDFQFIQQESTFWRRSLWNKAGSSLNKSLRLAGDLELWTRFFRHDKLFTTNAELAGFRYRTGQRSTVQRLSYLEECVNILKRERAQFGLWRRLTYTILRPPALFIGFFFFTDWPLIKRIYPAFMGIPPVISYDFSKMQLSASDRQVKFPSQMLFGRQISIGKRNTDN